ncbi:hypothetical protein Y11_28511 [Yersinia enterocolitica subsp. palearctica Y11]|uniref:Uncharacterized protein n=1 Tax=Yersinia enterocolitica subsp. palearctica serotype O:3 (strain DSM 13030 / CIP 106945 / Y11) TaxID=930944 RepID=A0A0H3NLS3_YERE1|nr:hypothetical protein Y11_28511 [Yersinia enterocolitica subsp. palearctica Y11]CCO70759.1 hypothetical protein D322_3913 [Yersinia enterocolitica IP 10393]
MVSWVGALQDAPVSWWPVVPTSLSSPPIERLEPQGGD